MALLKPRKPAPPDGQMELMEHLAELRTRILRSLLYVLVGMVLTYNLFHQIYDVLAYPLLPILAKTGSMLIFSGIAEPFLLQLQVSLIAGLAVALPFITLEIWGFVEPALTPEERKPVRYLAPFSVLLFLAGIATGYASLPTAYGWMSTYIFNVPGAALMQHAEQYILLTVKIILAFGIAFQLPLILLFLARIGVITASLMSTYWRHATVGIAAAAAILTPSNDPMTMLMMAIPMAGLYLLSIGLVRAFEPKADGTRSISLGPMILVALVPVAILCATGYWLYRTNPAAKARAVTAGINAPFSPAEVEKQRADMQSLRQMVEEQAQEIQQLQQQVRALQAAGHH